MSRLGKFGGAIAATAVPCRLRNRLTVLYATAMLLTLVAATTLLGVLMRGNETLSLSGLLRSFVDTDREIALLVICVTAAIALVGIGGRMVATLALAPLAEITAQVTALRTAPLTTHVLETTQTGELPELIHAINDRLDRAQAAVQQERSVIDDLAHELRTSLTAQILSAEMALSGARGVEGLPSASREVVCDMLDEARHMEQLITGLLKLARLRNSCEAVELQRVDVVDEAQSCAQLLQVLAEQKRQLLTVIGDGRPFAQAEPTMLRQSLMSIVHNAIDHCQNGACIRVCISAATGPGHGVNVCVEDNGPGIPAERHAKIFERFVRGEGRYRTGRGLGLGLAIAKAMTEAQGGSIRLDSTVEQGTRFLLTFRTAENVRAKRMASRKPLPGSVSFNGWSADTVLRSSTQKPIPAEASKPHANPSTPQGEWGVCSWQI